MGGAERTLFSVNISLTRAPVAVSANFALVGGGGGGICYHPPLTQKLRGIERRGKKHSIALNAYVLKYICHFHLRAILGSPEVIKIKISQMSLYFSEIMPLSQEL